MSKLWLRVLIVFIMPMSLAAQNPCSEPHARALVMGGGGSKGAFQAGAVYHLVEHRGCDFTEISGTSVGALNGAILAQAQSDSDPTNSLQTLRRQTDSMISMWYSIRSSKDIVKGRPMATLRFGLFGLESMKNFEPLHRLIQKNVSPERLQDGRDLRVGTVSFHDGRYHEIVLNAEGTIHPHTIDHLFGSAILPMFGSMPRVPQEATGSQSERVQFADGALRHTTPINSYFQMCGKTQSSESLEERCWSVDGSVTPAHPRIEQLFVVTTSPYERGQLERLVFDPKSYAANTRQIRDGRKIMARALDLLMDSMYRSDLDSMYFNNDLLRWQADQTGLEESGRTFPVKSYNTDPSATTLSARPYLLAVILPEKEDAEITAMLDFSPKRIAEQLYCGCIAADRMMQRQFRAESMSGSCRDRFRPKVETKDKTPTHSGWFSPETCSAPVQTNRSVAQVSPKVVDGSRIGASGQHQ